MLIAAAHLVTADGANKPVPFQGFVEITDGAISGVGPGLPARPADVTLETGYLLPGFVDLQVNGYFGADFQTADAGSWRAVAGRLPETGTTSFAPTVITAPIDSLVATLRGARPIVAGLPPGGARVLGVHVEG
ncbi:MAG: N-acetylglucosamine-6-phosphate deacetylase, partial [Streptosporangiaceae bacterium]